MSLASLLISLTNSVGHSSVVFLNLLIVERLMAYQFKSFDTRKAECNVNVRYFALCMCVFLITDLSVCAAVCSL